MQWAKKTGFRRLKWQGNTSKYMAMMASQLPWYEIYPLRGAVFKMNPGQKVSGQNVSGHKVSKSDMMCQKVSSQKVSKTYKCVQGYLLFINE